MGLQKAFQTTHDVFAIFTLMHPLEIGSRYTCDPQSKARSVIGDSWLACHDEWLRDLAPLRNSLVLPFEAWFRPPHTTARTVEDFLNLRERIPVTLSTGRRLRGGSNEMEHPGGR